MSLKAKRKKMASVVSSFTKRLALAYGYTAGIAIGIMAVTTFTEVILRYVFNSPTKYTVDLAGYLLVAAVFLGASYTQTKEGHIGVALFVGLLRSRVRDCLRLAMSILSCGFLVFFTWRCWLLFWQSLEDGRKAYAVWQVPLAIPQALMPLGSALWCLVVLSQIFSNVSFLLKKEEEQ
jgi:TRAP-type C4-dicarboxylate transport system permease small subunit